MKIITLHKGNQPYLNFVLQQAKAFNPTAEVVLIGDNSNKHLKNITHRNMDEWAQEKQKMDSVYVNFYPEDEKEKVALWFSRWFMILGYCKEQNLTEPFWIIDSDVLLYRDLREVPIPPNFDMTVTHIMDPCYSYFKDKSILEEFCEFLFTYYTKRLDEITQEAKQGAFIHDMHFLKKFCDLRSERVFNLAQVLPDKSSFVWNQQDGNGVWETLPLAGVRLKWMNGIPFGLRQGEWIRCNAIHFIGGIKHRIASFYRGPHLPGRALSLLRWRYLRIKDFIIRLFRVKT